MSYKPEIKASKSDKRLRSCGHSKFCMFSYLFSFAHEQCSPLLIDAHTPTLEKFDIPDISIYMIKRILLWDSIINTLVKITN